MTPPGARAISSGERIAFAVATVGGVGYSPIAAGTLGSLLAAVALWLIPFTPTGLAATLAAVTVVGIWTASRVERVLGAKDPGVIVIDEVAGMMLAVLGLPLRLSVIASAFFLFRLFDVWKPFPARQSQALGGGLGVVLDDLIAGAYALLIVTGARALLGVPA
ncbi:MAG: phosphatidylglycerophosphatase A [Candidatus Rokubacteria bacterium]|nr:phosphatidylglycerophosphatase A [Candidatus Rokubacteria bacterium]